MSAAGLIYPPRLMPDWGIPCVDGARRSQRHLQARFNPLHDRIYQRHLRSTGVLGVPWTNPSSGAGPALEGNLTFVIALQSAATRRRRGNGKVIQAVVPSAVNVHQGSVGPWWDALLHIDDGAW